MRRSQEQATKSLRQPIASEVTSVVTSVVEHLLDVPPLLAYILILALAFGEAAVFIGFVLPGETAVILGGVLASQHRMSLWLLLILIPLAAIAGDSVGYEVGQRFGPRVLASRPMRRHEHRLTAAKAFLRERGGWAVFLGRFTAFLRAVMPGLAGVSHMPYRRFLVFNAAGGIVWGAGFVLVGFFAGSSYEKIEKTAGRASALALIVIVAVVLIAWHLRRRARERDEVEDVGDPADV